MEINICHGKSWKMKFIVQLNLAVPVSVNEKKIIGP